MSHLRFIPPATDSHRLTDAVSSAIPDEILRRRLCDSAVATSLALKVGHKAALDRYLDVFAVLRDLYLARHPDADIDGIIREERARAKILKPNT